MFAIHGLGLLNREDPDMNRELKLAGSANVLSGLSGGMIGLPSYSLSGLCTQMGAGKTVWPGLIAVVVCGILTLFGCRCVQAGFAQFYVIPWNVYGFEPTDDLG